MITAMAKGTDALAVGDSAGEIIILSEKEGEVRHRWVAHQGPVRRLEAQGRRWLSAGADGSVALWDENSRIIWRRRYGDYAVNDAVLRGNQTAFVGGDRGGVARLDPQWPWRRPGEHGPATFALALDLDGQKIASGGADGRVIVRELKRGEQVGSWPTQQRWVTAILWTEYGILSGGNDGSLKLWQGFGSELKRQINTLPGPVLRLLKSGRRVFVSAGHGAFHSYDLPTLDAGPSLVLSQGGFYPIAIGDRGLYFGTPTGDIKLWKLDGQQSVEHLWP